MAFGTQSAIFNSWVYDALYPTTSFAGTLSAITQWKAALFNNSVTPDRTAVSASCAYNGGTWTTGNEVTDSTNWQAKGRALAAATPASPPASYSAQDYVMFDSADTAGGGNVTLSNVYGDLVYEDDLSTPVTDQALCFHSYGGSAQGVTAGTFTIVWHANGVARWTHALA